MRKSRIYLYVIITSLFIGQFVFSAHSQAAILREESSRERETELRKIIEEERQRREKIILENEFRGDKIAELLQRQEALITEQMQLKTQQEELIRKERKLNASISELLRSVVQEKTFAQILFKEQLILAAKLKKMQMLWNEGRRLYSRERYEEAIHVFEEIIKIEGEK
jgi:hypothetical protein